MLKRSLVLLLVMLSMVSPICLQACNLNGRSAESSRRVFDGFAKVLDGAEGLLHGVNRNAAVDIQHLADGVSSLVKSAMTEVALNPDEHLKIAMLMDGFRDQVGVLFKTVPFRNDGSIDPEQRKMVEGLTTILYNVISILINPSQVGAYLPNILGGLYKIISAVLADGRVDQSDWDHLMGALKETFSLSNLGLGGNKAYQA